MDKDLEQKVKEGWKYRCDTINAVRDLIEILYQLENENLNLSKDKLAKLKRFAEIEVMNMISDMI